MKFNIRRGCAPQAKNLEQFFAILKIVHTPVKTAHSLSTYIYLFIYSDLNVVECKLDGNRLNLGSSYIDILRKYLPKLQVWQTWREINYSGVYNVLWNLKSFHCPIWTHKALQNFKRKIVIFPFILKNLFPLLSKHYDLRDLPRSFSSVISQRPS